VQESSSTVAVEMTEVVNKPAEVKADSITNAMLTQQLAERDQALTRQLAERDQQFSRMLEQFTSLQNNFDQFKQAALPSSGTTTTSSTSSASAHVSQPTAVTGQVIANASVSDTISSASSASAVQALAHKPDASAQASSSPPAVAPKEVSVEVPVVHSPAPVVPRPWVALLNDDGETYYHNSETDETSWDLPLA
jgi:hypothetical protein